MASSDFCNVCERKVLIHSFNMRCDICHTMIHLKCLPNVDKTESIYISRESSIWYCTRCIEHIFPFNHIHDDDDFLSTLAENWDLCDSIPYEILKHQNQLFLPFDLNENFSSPLAEMDPDINYYNSQCNANLNSCDYYLENSFNKKVTELEIDDRAFSLLHSNIRSAVQNIDKLDSYLSTLNHKFSIVALSESWLKNHNHELYGLSGYRSEHQYRTHKGGGGVSIFIREGLEYFRRDDISVNNNVLESLFIEIDKECIEKTQNAIIGVLYRPPGTDVHVFNEYLEGILSTFKAEKKLLYLLGDYNIDLLQADKHTSSQEFLDILYSYHLIPSITKPTRVTKKSATLIDNIFSNDIGSNKKLYNGILFSDITDHYPIFHIDYSCSVTTSDSLIKKRIYSPSNIANFSSALCNHNWDHVLENNDPQSAYSSFIKDYTDMYNTHFPLKSYKIGYKTRKTWLSEGMKNSIKTKNRLYRRQKITKNHEHEKLYKSYRNKLNNLLLNAEKEHYEKLMDQYKYNLKKSWSLLKEVINRKKSSSSCSRFLINNVVTNDKKNIANGFNSFFTNVGPSLASKIPSDSRCPSIFLKNRVSNSIVINEVVSREVTIIIKNLKEGSS